MAPVSIGDRQRLRRWGGPLLVVLVLGALPLWWLYGIRPDDQHWMVDLQVYRDAGVSNLIGRPVYEHLTDPPLYLPFTYPPFASILAMPLALLPFRVIGALWFLAQLAAAGVTVRVLGAPLLRRAGSRAPWVWALLTLMTLWTLPVADGLRFGQVNAFLVLACLVDVVRPRLRGLDRVMRRVPRGVLVGLATAIKLTPGVFIVHFLITRQWRAAATAIGSAAAVTVGAFVLLPTPSFAFWGGALSDPERLGRNDGTANQSLRGVLLRDGPDGRVGDLLWLLLVVAVLVIGYGAARRATAAGERLLAFACVAVVGVLVSPVSWIHHFHWVLPALFVLAVPADRDEPLLARPARVAGVAALWLLLVLHVPWWAHWRLVSTAIYEPSESTGNPFWTVLHDSYLIGALVILLALAVRARGLGRRRPAPGRPGTPRSSAAAAR